MGCGGPAAWLLFLEDLRAGLSRTPWEQRSGEQHSHSSVFSTARGLQEHGWGRGLALPDNVPGAAQHSQVCSVHVLADSLCLTWPQGSVLSSSQFSTEHTLPGWAQEQHGLYINFFFFFAPSICQVLDFNFLLLRGRGQWNHGHRLLMLIFVWFFEWRSRLCFFSPPCSGLLVVQSIMQLFHASRFVLIKVVEEIV